MAKSTKHIPFRKGPWSSRGYLKHFDGADTIQSVTIRLHDSLPQSLLKELIEQTDSEVSAKKSQRRYSLIERYIDKGYGACHLRLSTIAAITQNALLYLNETKYQLHAWVIMPNHVHFLLTPNPEFKVAEIVRSIKTFTARESNLLLKRSGPFWHREYYDRYIRNENHFTQVVDYIEGNPVAAGLCKTPKDWTFSSAADKNCLAVTHRY